MNDPTFKPGGLVLTESPIIVPVGLDEEVMAASQVVEKMAKYRSILNQEA